MKSKLDPTMAKRGRHTSASRRGITGAATTAVWRWSRTTARVVLPGCVILLCLTACRTAPPPVADTSALEVQAFVRQTFIHGVPYDAAHQFDARVVPVLWRMLADPAEEPHWPNITVLLAIIGDKEVAAGLMQYIRADHDGLLSPAHYAAKTGALMALGYNVHRTEDPGCLDYLTRCATPDYWRNLDLEWRAPFPQSAEERNAQLATLAVLGLALSGLPEAERRLEALRQFSATPEGAEIRATVGNVLDEAINACQTIQREGLIEYCRPHH